MSESFGKILDISTAKMIPLDLWGRKIHNLKATLRLIFHRKLFKSLKLTKLKFWCQFINIWKHNDYLPFRLFIKWIMSPISEIEQFLQSVVLWCGKSLQFTKTGWNSLYASLQRWKSNAFVTAKLNQNYHN